MSATQPPPGTPTLQLRCPEQDACWLRRRKARGRLLVATASSNGGGVAQRRTMICVAMKTTGQ
eukprot:1054003-Alexandrium_andersonii.AAC.1